MSYKFNIGDKVRIKALKSVPDSLKMKMSEITDRFKDNDGNNYRLEGVSKPVLEDALMSVAKGKDKSAKSNWYLTKKPSAKTYDEYDFARNDDQAKKMLEDLKHLGAVAEKTERNGGKYTIWVRK